MQAGQCCLPKIVPSPKGVVQSAVSTKKQRVFCRNVTIDPSFLKSRPRNEVITGKSYGLTTPY